MVTGLRFKIGQLDKLIASTFQYAKVINNIYSKHIIKAKKIIRI